MSYAKKILLFIFSFSILNSQFSILFAQQKASIAFWNVENLYDTIPSGKYDDGDYTPTGARDWNTMLYRAKLARVAATLDSISADIVGLAEIENETALKDLVGTIKAPYNYIFPTGGRRYGRDVALLYRGDRFFPNEQSIKQLNSGTGRKFLYVEGELLGEKVALVVVHMASNLNNRDYRLRNMTTLRARLEELLTDDPAARIITMGDMNAVPDDKIIRQALGGVRNKSLDFVYCPHYQCFTDGEGSYNYRSRWYLYDWMTVSPAIARARKRGALRVEDAGIYAREFLVETAPNGIRRPIRSLNNLTGYSDHLPVWMVVVK